MYYVIQVKTGKEQKAIDDIRKQSGFDSGIEVFAPTRKVMRKYGGVYKEVTERCFPGYLFVDTKDAKALFFDLYWVPDYTRLLGREGLTYNFCPLNEEESRMVDILYNANKEHVTEISNIEVVEGDKIRVLDGPLRDVQAKVKKVDLHKRTVLVEITLFNRSMEAKLGINIITKVPDAH